MSSIPQLNPTAAPTNVHRIADGSEALVIARDLAASFIEGARERDQARQLPEAEIERFSRSGLWAISVPREHGGADVAAGTVAEVFATIAAADGSLGQIPQNHFYMVEALRLDATSEQKSFYFAKVLSGERIGNALNEIGGKNSTEYVTTALPDEDGFILNGRKYYSTGVIFAHWVAVVANNADGKRLIVLLPRETPGLTIQDDWNGFGQRTTASGTTIFNRIRVAPSSVVEHFRAFERPTAMGSFAQIMHAAIDLGLARGAWRDTLDFVRHKARAFPDSGVDHGYEEPYIIAAVGDLRVRLTAAEALVERASDYVEKARREPHKDACEAASIAVAEARVATTEASLYIASKLFELGGSSSTSLNLGYDRHWRDARTHTLHDPVRWKYHAVGNYWLNGIAPPRRGTI